MNRLRKSVVSASLVALLALGGAACNGDDAETEVEEGVDQLEPTAAVTE